METSKRGTAGSARKLAPQAGIRTEGCHHQSRPATSVSRENAHSPTPSGKGRMTRTRLPRPLLYRKITRACFRKEAHAYAPALAGGP